MYLTRISVTQESDIIELNNYDMMHKVVESFFKDKNDSKVANEALNTLFGKKDSRNIYRVLKKGRDGEFVFLLLSSEKPLMPEKPIVQINNMQTKEYDSYLNKVVHHEDKLQFEVEVNPVIRREGRDFPIKMLYEIEKWFVGNALKWGFTTEMIEVHKTDLHIVKRKNTRKVKFNSAVIRGVLKIDNEELFMNSLRNGIGRKTPYGFGLLNVIPIRKEIDG